MVGKGNFAVFESSNISETGQAMPTNIGVHACGINTYLHELFELIVYQLFISTGPLLWDSRGDCNFFLLRGCSNIFYCACARGMVLKKAGFTKNLKR